MSNVLPFSARAIVRALEHTAHDIIMRHCSTTAACIVSSRALVELLLSYGVDASAICVRVVVRNAVQQYHLAKWAEHNPKRTPPLMVQRHWRDDLGAHEIGIGFGSDEPMPGYDGHVVVYVPQLRLVLDASIRQVDRPHKNIGPMPSLLVVPWDLEHDDVVSNANVDGRDTYLRYEIDRGRDDFKDAPDWTVDASHIVDELRAAVERELRS